MRKEDCGCPQKQVLPSRQALHQLRQGQFHVWLDCYQLGQLCNYVYFIVLVTFQHCFLTNVDDIG